MSNNPRFLYDDVFTLGTPDASTTDAGNFNVLNLRDNRNYTFWSPAALPATVTVDAGVSTPADYLLVWGHDLFTHAVTIELRGSTDNFIADDNLVVTKTPTDDKPFLIEFASVSFRYWRYNITGAGNTPHIAIAKAGVTLVSDVGMFRGFDPIGVKIVGRTAVSQRGNSLGKIIEYQEWAENVVLNNLSWTWVHTDFKNAWDTYLKGNPFVFAWNTEDFPDELALVNTKGSYAAKHKVGGQLIDLRFNITGILAR